MAKIEAFFFMAESSTEGWFHEMHFEFGVQEIE
jgi:hypothetical protein